MNPITNRITRADVCVKPDEESGATRCQAFKAAFQNDVRKRTASGDWLDEPGETMTTTETISMTAVTEASAEVRRRREIEFLARDLFNHVQDVVAAVGNLVPAQLAAGDGDLDDCAPLQVLAQELDDTLTLFDLLQEELGLPPGHEPRYRRFLREKRDEGAIATD
jgi:hypothetical protein